jgi:hypothetical protein
MSTVPPEIGKNNYRQLIARGQMAATAARESLRRIVDEQPGPQTTALLLARAGLRLGELVEVLAELDEIGRKARNLKE